MWMNTVKTFVELALDERLLGQLQTSCPAAREGEQQGWLESLQPLARALQHNPGLQGHHIALEVPMLNSSERADAVVLGANNGVRAVVVIEIKRYINVTGAGVGAIDYPQAPHHPCCQARGYLEQLLYYDAALTNQKPPSMGKAIVFMPGCARPDQLNRGTTAAAQRYHAALVQAHPVFGTGGDQARATADYIAEHLSEPPTEDFVNAFRVRQRSADRHVSDEIGAVIQGNNPYQLSPGPQQEAFKAIDDELKRLAEEMARELKQNQQWDGRRRVVIVHGPAGSGKSVVAAYAAMKAIASLDSGGHGLKDGVFCCTSSDQLRTHALELEVAKQQFQNGLHGNNLPLCSVCRNNFPMVKFDQNGMYYRSDYESAGAFENAVTNNAPGDRAAHETYAEYCGDWLKRLRVKAKADVEANAANPPPYSFILCDEAAGLVDPRTGEGHENHWVGGALAMAWRKPRGPAAAHIILKSRLSVFFIDDVQGFQQQETTSREMIRLLAEELDADVTEHALQGVQFRVAGSAALIDWLDDTLGMPKCSECRKYENDKVHDPVQPGRHAFTRLVPQPDLPEDQMRMAFQIVTNEQLPEEVKR